MKRRLKTKTKTKKATTSAKKAKTKTSTDLNARFTVDLQTIRRRPVNFGSGEVWFDAIEEHLARRMQDSRNVYALVASPWCSSQSILSALRTELDGVSLLTNVDKSTRSEVRTKAFKALPKLEGYSRVRYTGALR